MKKSISLILALALALSVLSLSAFAADTKTENLFNAIEETKEVCITFRTGRTETFGESYSVINTVHMKGEDIAYDFDNGFFKLRTTVDEGKLLSYLPAFPFVYMSVADLPIAGIDVWGTIKSLSDFTMEFLVFQGSYTTTIDGVTYYVEEFNDRGSVVNSFYYIGDELKVLKAQDFAKETIQYTYFDSVSLDVDTSVFSKPLMSFELTAVLQFFIKLLSVMSALPVA